LALDDVGVGAWAFTGDTPQLTPGDSPATEASEPSTEAGPFGAGDVISPDTALDTAERMCSTSVDFSRSAALSERRRAAPSGDCLTPDDALGEAELDSRREAELEWFNPTEWFNPEWLVDVASFSLRAASTIPGSATPCGDLGGLGDVIVRGLVLNIVERWRVRGDLSDGDETFERFDVELKLW
jgi:hypothetical protein